jgi:hypothetical protein
MGASESDVEMGDWQRMKITTAQSMKCGHDSRWTSLFDHFTFISLAGIIRVSIATQKD